MELHITGNPGQDNHFVENNIGHVKQYNANTTQVTININLNVNIHLKGELLASFVKKMVKRFGLKTTAAPLDTHVNEHSASDRGIYYCYIPYHKAPDIQFRGTPTQAVKFLQDFNREMGEAYVESVSYQSSLGHIERNHLSLPEAIQLAKAEKKILSEM